MCHFHIDEDVKQKRQEKGWSILTSDSGIPTRRPCRSKFWFVPNKADSKFLNGWCSCVTMGLSEVLNLFACWARRSRIWRSSRLFILICCCWEDVERGLAREMIKCYFHIKVTREMLLMNPNLLTWPWPTISTCHIGNLWMIMMWC